MGSHLSQQCKWFPTPTKSCLLTSDQRMNITVPIFLISLGLALLAYVICLASLTLGPSSLAMMLMPSVIAYLQAMLLETLNIHMARPYSKRL